MLGQAPLDDLCRGALRSEVSHHDGDTPIWSTHAQALGHLVEPLLVAIHEREIAAIADKPFRQGRSDAAGRASDKGDSSIDDVITLSGHV